MTKMMQFLPDVCETTSESVIAATRKIAETPLLPGSSEAKSYCATLSKLLLTDPRALPFPELQALGFWLRPAATENMVRQYLEVPLDTPRASIGIVFQLPPSNVATLFGYTSAISLLSGNATIIRLSSTEHPAQVLLTTFIKESLQQSPPALRNRMIVLRYNHDDSITEQLSSVSNVRLVWGSDATVEHIANLALPALSRHVSFGDRFSAMAIKAESYAALDDDRCAHFIQNVFNDTYVFDQLACSSPRLLVWIGNEDVTQQVAEDFYPRLAEYATGRGYQADIGGYLAKVNTSYLALHDLWPDSYKVYAPSLTVITLPDLHRLSSFKGVNYGYGTLLATRLHRLADLAPFTEPCDQTLGVWGLDKAEIQSFTEQSQRRGFDRIVSIGQALTFDPIWDGYNLFDVITHLIQFKP